MKNDLLFMCTFLAWIAFCASIPVIVYPYFYYSSFVLIIQALALLMLLIVLIDTRISISKERLRKEMQEKQEHQDRINSREIL